VPRKSWWTSAKEILVRDSIACYLPRLTTLRTVPQDYDDLLSYYTRAGYRVIAVAGKTIEGLSWLKAQRMKRYGSPSFPEPHDVLSNFLEANKLRAVFVSLDWLSLRTSSNLEQRPQFFRYDLPTCPVG
jgi:hypothetical protein